MHQVFSLGWHSTASEVKCMILLLWQCDFTQLWGNQPTKIGRKALCIRIKINKFKKQYIQWVKLQILSSSFFPSFSKIKKKEKEIKQTRKVTLKSKEMWQIPAVKASLCMFRTKTITFSNTLLVKVCYDIAQATTLLRLLQNAVSLGQRFAHDYISLQTSSKQKKKQKPKLYPNSDSRQLAHSTWECSNFLYPRRSAAERFPLANCTRV